MTPPARTPARRNKGPEQRKTRQEKPQHAPQSMQQDSRTNGVIVSGIVLRWKMSLKARHYVMGIPD
jgi:hypothetical protein